MAKLTYSARKKLPLSSFAVKKGRRFPIQDKAHARNALARLSNAKGLSAAQRSAIKSKAYKMLYGTDDERRIDLLKKSRAKVKKSHARYS